MPNPIIRLKRGSGSPVSLQTGEVAFDTLNKSLFIGTAEGVLPIGGEHVFAKKTFVSDAVAAEGVLRAAGDSTLTTNLNSEISRAQGAEGVIAAGLAQELLDRAAAVSGEASARVSGDSALDAKIETEKGRINAILALSDTDKDSLKELVDLIQGIDTANDQAFAGYVTSNNAALASEVTNRQSGDATLQGNIDDVASDLSALTTRVSAAEQDILDEVSDRQSAITGVQANVDSEAASRAAAIVTVTGLVTSEASTRATADTSLSNRITSLEGVSSDSRLTSLEADVADHESRISALETVIDGGTY
jgi:uncharacterized coiled-coil protein SlyX